ncbi:hypothetical protein LB506_004398, partial [Fusarium annulatum]
LFLPFLSLHEPANYLTLTSVLPLLCRLALVFPSSLFFHPRSFNAHALIFLSVPPLTPFVLTHPADSSTRLPPAVLNYLSNHHPTQYLFGPVSHWYKVLPP